MEPIGDFIDLDDGQYELPGGVIFVMESAGRTLARWKRDKALGLISKDPPLAIGDTYDLSKGPKIPVKT